MFLRYTPKSPKIKRPNYRKRKLRPHILIRLNGTIYIGRETCEQLGIIPDDYNYVLLFFDQDEPGGMIGIKLFYSKRHLNEYRAKPTAEGNSAIRISCKGFLDHYGILPAHVSTMLWAKYKSGMIIAKFYGGEKV